MLSKFYVFLVILLVAGCAHQNSIAKKKHEWLFAHIAPQGNVGDGTTIVMPVTQDFIAFTMDPYTLHSKVNVNEFISLIDKSNLKNRINEPRRAVLSWYDGNIAKEENLLITDIKMSEFKDRIIYTAEKIVSFKGTEEFSSPHLYIDRHDLDKQKRPKEIRKPFYMAPTKQYTSRHRLPQVKEKVIPTN
tara:strand:- start:193 stop:759 length:567 start_codon:yes stop_codon:yes gene_type:complete